MLKLVSILVLAAYGLAGCSAPSAARPTVAAVRPEPASAWTAAAVAPRAQVAPAPAYPFEAWRAKQAAEVRVTFRTDTAGRVVAVGCVEPADPRFCAATARALAHWRFGEKSAGPFRLTFRYTVNAQGASIHWE